MGRASRRKRARRRPLFIDVESYVQKDVAAYFAAAEWAQIEHRVYAAMNANPAHLWRNNMMSGQWGSQRRTGWKREHPLEFQPGYRFIGFDKRFGDAPVYKVNTKEIGDHMRHGELITDTSIYVSRDGFQALQPELMLGAVCWIRRVKLEDIKTACAFLLMLDRQPVILRAFEP